MQIANDGSGGSSSLFAWLWQLYVPHWHQQHMLWKPYLHYPVPILWQLNGSASVASLQPWWLMVLGHPGLCGALCGQKLMKYVGTTPCSPTASWYIPQDLFIYFFMANSHCHLHLVDFFSHCALPWLTLPVVISQRCWQSHSGRQFWFKLCACFFEKT